ncbi:MAG: hypothetical protein LIP03_06820 [Bacteroidales bacterium]|nr:hypothetical protein [Bacteroidales bacterium]
MLVASFTLAATSCSDHDFPKNPTLVSPISGLIIEVNGEDYTALPSLTDNGTFSDTYLLSVKIPSRTATIVQLSFSDNTLTSDIQAGDEVTFEDNMLAITAYRNGSVVDKYCVEMSFNPPPYYYFIKSSDKDADGNRYYLDLDNPQTIASGTYDEWYEGYVDLTMSNWDNVGLITSDLETYYDYNGGPWPALSYYTWVGTAKSTPGTGYYPCDGPWNDWTVTNDNPDIVSPGVWHISFNSSTFEVYMTETQWCVSGSAVGSLTPMTFSSDTRTWSLSTYLSAGSFLFETTPVTFGNPTFNLGLSSGISDIASGGDEIEIAQAGQYTIVLDLSNPPYYTYSLTQN